MKCTVTKVNGEIPNVEINAYVLSGQELSYVFKLVAHDVLEKKKKYESAKKVYEHTNEFFQELGQQYNKYVESLENKDE